MTSDLQAALDALADDLAEAILDRLTPQVVAAGGAPIATNQGA